MSERPDQPILNLVGEKVALGPIRRDQLPRYLRWLNDFEYSRTTSVMRPFTVEALAESFERDTRDPRQVHFTIYERKRLRPIGGASLTEIANGTATFALGIGEKDDRGCGYGTEATRLVLDYGFNVLGRHNIWLWVLAFNRAGIAAYQKAGFKVIGRRREAVNRFGTWHDVLLMDCLASEFERPEAWSRSSTEASAESSPERS